jgi:hypothetical protein
MTFAGKNHRLSGAIVVLICLVGCGEKSTTVTGTVSYNGEPVNKGSISFRPTDGSGQSFAARIVNGQYSADRGTPGTKTVVVTGVKDVDFFASSEESYKKAEEARKAGSLQADVAEVADYIAENAEGNSKQVEILSGDQTVDFSITGASRE